MKKIYKSLIASALLLVFASAAAFGQAVVKGKVQDADTGEPLIGATLAIVGGTSGCVTDYDGNFALKVAAFPVKVRVTYTGFVEQILDIASADERPNIKLATNAIIIAEAVVKGQRIDDKQKAAPLTIENLDAIAIKETPSVNFYSGLGNLKGVDLTTASLGFTIINTRGFNSTSPVRSLQIIDGVDNQAPGLNFSLGNFLGCPDLDVQKVDLVVGASSTFYGPNAFNGVISMESKNPFLNRGLAVSLKYGERNLLEGALRYADAFKNKAGHDVFAFKLNFFGLRANDWVADNYDPVSGDNSGALTLVPTANAPHYPAAKNPGRWDAVNIYGDEPEGIMDARGSGLWQSPRVGLGIWHRRGYREEDLVDYNTRNAKASVALHFRTQPSKEFDSPELILASNFGTGTTVYQGDNRFSLRDILFFQNRIEFRKKDKYFIRAYATNEDAGKSFDPYFTALQMLDSAKSNEQWANAYSLWWQATGKIYYNHMVKLGYPDLGDSTALQPWYDTYRDSLVNWHNLAADYADKQNALPPGNKTQDFFQPGTQRFQDLFDRITSRKSNSREHGTMFYDKSALYHANAEYIFTPRFVDKWTVGAAVRLYRPVSDGTIFQDSAVAIHNSEWGAYTGAEQTFGDFKVAAALRVDKNENFDMVATPAASLVWHPGTNTYWRFSFSSAIRNPTLTDQYLNLNVGRALLVGNLHGFDSLITIESFNAYRSGAFPQLSKIKYYKVGAIQPEKVKTFEVGWRSTIFKKLYVDAGYYYSIYNDFIGYNIGIKTKFDFFGYPDNSLKIYRVAANSTQTVTTQGFSIGLNYYFKNYYMLAGNYSWNKLNTKTDDPIVPAYNTPQHKYNVSLSARDLPLKLLGVKNSWGFNVTYKWIQGFTFEGSPQFTGEIPTYDLLDGQVNATFPRLNSTLKIGAANLLNKLQFQTYGGPRIGRMAYISWIYDFRKK